MVQVEVYELAFLASCLFLCAATVLGTFFMSFCALFGVYVFLCLIWLCKKSSLSVKGKAVFITGCDTGFGHGLALRLHGEGFRVFAGCLFPDGDGAKTLKGKCPENMYVVSLDVTKEDSVQEAEKYVRDNLEDTHLWGLVNNAGLMTVGEIELISVETFKRVYDVNVFGVLRVTKAFLPLIRNCKGRVVLISSVSGMVQMPSNTVYSSSKSALESIGDCLRMEMRKFGIGVYLIEPGGFAGNTSIASGENAKRVLAAADREWGSLSDEVKGAYGEDYLKSQVAAGLKAAGNSTSTSMEPVLDAIQDALLSTQPACRNLIHGGHLYLDPLVVFATITPYMPTFVADWLFCRLVYGSGKWDKQAD